MTTETQSKIRAIAVKDRERARALVNPAHYFIRKRRTIVDGDYDSVRWGWVWDLVYDGPRVDMQTVSVHASVADAAKHLDERCAALDGEDCRAWAWCGVPVPADFVP